ncbi:efflux RND transporter periplasmic adaptor subunit [Allosphingosinicella vermicomposti]|uniref:efflux RND transporter periplasmic adaptor subunit n=1 Tax=Allosphingosinicella vermicomposti TaxID=614671 RepID=UPI000D108AA3|nr:HlyD family efflux transporter periplasmic adaptor subunit [Allosphingosinicella vermicomposti]
MKTKLLTGPRIITVLVLLAVAVATLFALRTPALEVEVGQVSRGPLVVTVSDLGQTRVRDLYVVSAPVAGEAQRVPLKPGAKVVPGQTILARIVPADPAPLDARSLAQARANVRAAEAELAAARARVANAQASAVAAERTFGRIADLADRGFASRAQFDEARAARDANAAAVSESRNMVGAAAEKLAAANAALIVPGGGRQRRGIVAVTSPVPGYVLTVPQESARVVLAGTPLVEVGDPSRLEIVSDLLSSDAVQVQAGAPVEIDAWGGERPLKGRVRLVEPFGFTKFSALGVEEQRVNAVIDFAEPRSAFSRLGHGYRTTVRIATWSARDALRVPVSALFRSGRDWALFVVEGGRAKLRRVRIGHITDAFGEVKGGLEADETVIIHPSDKVADGVKVRASN